MRFQAPQRPGTYFFTIYVRSDSYIELDVRYHFSITVHERPEEPEIHPQWEDSDSDRDDMGGFITGKKIS